MASFESAFSTVVGIEGGYSNDPRDPGGETKYGISKRAYPHLDIANLTLPQAHDVYRADYWTPAGCDALPALAALLVFDCAVNQGVDVAVKLAQVACGLVGDGAAGPKTRAAFANIHPLQLSHFMASRAVRYSHDHNYETYGHGWLNRLFGLVVTAVA